MKRWSVRSVSLALAATLSLFSAGATQPNGVSPPAPTAVPDLTVARLLGAMPSGCESVMVRRIDVLLAKDSTQREMLEYELKMYAASAKADGKPSGEPPKNELEQMSDELPAADAWDKVLATALGHKPLLHCVGASGFERPADLGVGPYNAREVWVCQESFGSDPYADATKVEGVTVQAEKPVRVLSMDKVDPVYRGKVHTEKVYVAFYKDRTLVRANSVQDVFEIVTALADPSTGVPSRWRKLADPGTLGSSMFVLRAFDPSQAARNWQLTKPLEKSAEPPNLIRVVLPAAKDTALTVTCLTKARTEARQMIQYWLGQAPLQETDAGLTSAAPAEPSPDAPQRNAPGDPRLLMLQMQSAMGIYIAI
jgi:hypothetical protein